MSVSDYLPVFKVIVTLYDPSNYHRSHKSKLFLIMFTVSQCLGTFIPHSVTHGIDDSHQGACKVVCNILKKNSGNNISLYAPDVPHQHCTLLPGVHKAVASLHISTFSPATELKALNLGPSSGISSIPLLGKMYCAWARIRSVIATVGSSLTNEAP